MSTGKVIVNSAAGAVSDSINGYLRTRNDLVRIIDPDVPSIKIVARKHVDRTKVALISGGGAGHEPSHVGFVAAGMLTAAVSGDVFASPHVNAIVTTMQYVAGIGVAGVGTDTTPAAGFPGILLVVKNYTGDRLAFGLAAEIIRSFGVSVEIVYVADDVAVDGGPVTGRRGLAGTVFVHKLAGAAAEAGSDLATVHNIAQNICSNVFTMGASLTTCNIPGVPVSDRLAGHETMELGLGIHGEPGAETVPRLLSARELCASLMNKIVEHAGKSIDLARHDAVMLVNNLGGLSNLEMGICVDAALRITAPFTVKYLLTGALMTSLDMKGLSISLLFVAKDSAGYETGTGRRRDLWSLLLSETPCPHWPTIVNITHYDTHDSAHDSARDDSVVTYKAPSLHALDGNGAPAPAVASPLAQRLQVAIEACCHSLIGATDLLNMLDSISGDGDCGSTMATIAQAVLAHKVPVANDVDSDILSATFSGLSRIVGNAAGGTSGVLYSIMLQAAANAIKTACVGAPLPNLLSAALTAAVSSTSKYAGARMGDRTMLDALIPANDALVDYCNKVSDDVRTIAAAAEQGAAATCTMIPRAGRASYVGDAVTHGHEDPGARAAAIWLEAAVGAALAPTQ